MRDYHLILVAMGIVCSGVFSAWHFHDPHIIARCGALVCGASAIFIIVQVLFETHIDRRKKEIEAREGHHSVDLSPGRFLPQSLMHRVGHEINKRAMDELHRRRMRFVIIVAAVTAIGEVIHGFGDVLYEKIAPEHVHDRDIHKRSDKM